MTSLEPSDEDLHAIEADGTAARARGELFGVLDDLFTEAQMAAENGRKRPRSRNPADAKALEAKAKSLREQFTLPENWERTRGVALVHRETDSLLGNFSEYVHRSIGGCRKLIRESAPITISAVEYVEGSWWLGESHRPEPRQQWHTQREHIMHLHLEPLGVFSPAVALVVSLSYGSIARVELAESTKFAASDGALQLELAKGINVLEVMGIDAKVKLREELGL